MKTKFCTRCCQEQSSEAFSPSCPARGWCRACHNEHRRNIRQGVTPKRPNQVCGWCGAPLDPKKRRHARWCSDACSAQGWRRANPGRQREHRLKAEYGIDVGTFDAMFQAQDGKCAICASTTSPGTGRGWQVDHCHVTGKVRAILCRLCNVGLGSFRDNATSLRAAADYVEHHRSDPHSIH